MSWGDRDWNRGDAGNLGPSFRADPMSWSPSVGTIFGIRVQIHILFIIYVAVELLRAATAGGFWWEVRYLVMLFGLVFLHEMGHCFGARLVGGSANNILMWPLGGLASVSSPHRPGPTFFTALAGPLVNVAVCIITALILILATGSIWAIPWNPFHSRVPASIAYLFWKSDSLLWIYQVFYISYILLLFNACLPVFPFDGGRMFQAICWARMGYRRSTVLATTAGMAGAILLGCFGLLHQDFLLIGIAVFGYLTCRQERQRAAVAADDEYQEHTPPARQGRLWPWQRIKASAWARRQKRLADEEAAVDRILAKVREQGMQSLKRSEKKTLAEATRRKQERDRQLDRTGRL